jgi:two-component system, NarL family, nitrate/nitrite response regulator NarL
MASPSSPRMLAETQLKAGQSPIRVLIALGSPMDCQLLQAALNGSRQQLEAVACAVSRTETIRCLSRGNVDVALINADLEDGRLTGLDVLSEIHASYRRTPVVTLFDTWNDDLIVHAFRAGAMGVFCRSEKKLDMLWKCISAVHEGQVWANSVQMQLLLRTLRKVTPIRSHAPPGMNLLAMRETQTANLVVEGLATKEIAKRLGITEHTVSNYLFRIYNKLGISSRVELVLYIMKHREDHEAAG